MRQNEVQWHCYTVLQFAKLLSESFLIVLWQCTKKLLGN